MQCVVLCRWILSYCAVVKNSSVTNLGLLTTLLITFALSLELLQCALFFRLLML